MHRLVWAFSLAALVLTFVASQASAQTDRDDEARALFEAAEAAYTSGHYEDALGRFEASHALSQRPELLFNIGATAERLRRDEVAIDAYERYLSELPTAANRAEVESRLTILRAAVAESDPAPAESPTDGGGGGRVMSWVFTGTTVAFAGLAIASWFIGGSEFDTLVEDCMNAGGCTEEQIDASSVRTWDRLTTASIIVAGASAAAAVVFFIVEGDDDAGDVAIGVGPGGVSVRGTF